MICQFNHQPCQYIACPLWDEGQRRCLFQMAVFKILGRPEKAPEQPALLTDTQRDILEMVARGYHTKRIAGALFISPRTVNKYVSDLLLRLDAKNLAHAITIAFQKGIISFEKGDALLPGKAKGQ